MVNGFSCVYVRFNIIYTRSDHSFIIRILTLAQSWHRKRHNYRGRRKSSKTHAGPPIQPQAIDLAKVKLSVGFLQAKKNDPIESFSYRKWRRR